MISELSVGPRLVSDGTTLIQRADRTGATVTTDAHARFMEAALRGNLFSGGMTTTSVSNATFTTGTLTASCTPIAGVWNPSNSGKNLVILQVRVIPVNTALQTTGGGALVWASSLLNTAISTGNAPLNRGTGAASGSIAKDMSGVALTGLTTTLVVRDSTGLAGGNMSNLSTLQTAAGLMPTQSVSIDHVDGALIVPPGGVVAVLFTTTPVAISMASSILWEEVSI